MTREHIKIKKAQKKLLKAFSKRPMSFALTGGTALELFYLRHRFSVDLDFFSPRYNLKEIEAIASEFKKYCRVKFENEFIAPSHARVRFYNAFFKDLARPIKIDFVEDILFDGPSIKIFDNIPVYSVDSIYLQKITAITGARIQEDEVGRRFSVGRQEARDAFDIYMLSKKIKPLYLFLKGLPSQLQRGMVHWYRVFSRQGIKLGILDLDIYIDKFDSHKMIIYLEDQIEKFIEEEVASE